MNTRARSKLLEAILKTTYSDHGNTVINDAMTLVDITGVKQSNALENLFELYFMFSLLQMTTATVEATNG